MASSSVPFRSRRRTAGAATVEAVIALPLFILLLVSAFYMTRLVLAQQDARTQARRCAWLYSNQACTQVPAGCEGVVGGTKDAKTPEQKAHVNDVTQEMDTLPSPLGGVLNVLIKPAIEATFGRSATATAKRNVLRPALFGGGEKEILDSYELACNLEPKTLDDVASDAWHAFGF